MNVTFAYRPEETVRITGLDSMKGRIETCAIKAGGVHQYLVSYWCDGRKQQEWCSEGEIIP